MQPASEVFEEAYEALRRRGNPAAYAVIEADRKQVREAAVREVAEWLRGEYWSEADWNVAHASNFASAIERKFLGEKA